MVEKCKNELEDTCNASFKEDRRSGASALDNPISSSAIFAIICTQRGRRNRSQIIRLENGRYKKR